MAAGDAAGQLFDPGVDLGHFLIITQVEHRGRTVRPVLLLVICAENAVEGIVGDAEIAVFVEIVVLVVASLLELHPFPLRLEREVLDAVHEFVITGGENAGGQRRRGLLLGAESIRWACDHRCAKAGLLDNTDDFVCGNTTRGCDDTRAAGRKVYGRSDDSRCSSKLALNAACAGSTGHPGDV